MLITVAIIVLPDGVPQDKIRYSSVEEIGDQFSNERTVTANKVADDLYTVLYRASSIMNCNIPNITKAITRLFRSNLPNQDLKYKIFYNFEDADKRGTMLFDPTIAERVLKLCDEFEEMHLTPGTQYVESQLISGIRRVIARYNMERNFPQQEEYDDEDEDDDDPYEDEDDDPEMDWLRRQMGFVDDDDDGTEIYHAKSKKHYSRSKVVSHADSPKKSYHRHGVIIADSKEDLEKDRKIIKEFLKDFIPGDGWRKEFRKDLADRWLYMFAVRKKELKKRQRKYEKKRKQESSEGARALALDLTRRVLTIPQSPSAWNDPNK